MRALYDSVPRDKRSKIFHGDCGEADVLSKIARENDVQNVGELRVLVEGATFTTLRNDGKPLTFCDSCSQL